LIRTLRFGYDGDGGLGDRLLEAVLREEKTATSSLAVEYLSGDPLPRVGERLALEDSDGIVQGTVETTKVTIMPLTLVGDDVARAEGEGFADAAEWLAITWRTGVMSQNWSVPTPAILPGSCVRLNQSWSLGFAWSTGSMLMKS